MLFDTTMRVRFLVSGLAFFAVAFVLAAVPVLAQGGTAPACTIKGTNGGDLLIGTANADVICGYGGSDHLYGQDGNDKIYARDAVKDWVYGGRGSDYARDDDPEDVLRSIESH